jgi:predicted esterase
MLLLASLLFSCRSESVRPTDPAVLAEGHADLAAPPFDAAPPTHATATPPARLDAASQAESPSAAHVADAASKARAPSAPFRGPFEAAFTPGRNAFFAAPASGSSARRIVGHLHGICYPPSYSCGKWARAATDQGYLVCPTGNATCGDSGHGPPSWEAPSWDELVHDMDRDLEQSIALVSKRFPGESTRDGAILTGFSRGAYAAPVLARMHPGRWPYLVLIEAAAPMTADSLQRSGVRAVAMVAGEQGPEIAGMRKIAEALQQSGFPVRFFMMPKVGHVFSDDVDQIMSDAFAFVTGY